VTPYLAALLNAKFRNPAAARKTLLEAHSWTASELEQLGIVDIVVTTPSESHDTTIVAARDLAESKAALAVQGAFAVIRREVMREIIQLGQLDSRLIFPEDEATPLKSKL
jgi:enoyl-CoA hydratase/carnithine racemase